MPQIAAPARRTVPANDARRPGARAATGGAATGVTLAVAVAVLALPSAVLGFGTKFQAPHDDDDASPAIAALHFDGSGARLARALSLSFLGRAPIFPFTPAKNPNRPDRSVTVAVRLDAQALKAIAGAGAKTDRPAFTASPVPIAQTAFNLGVARGYRNFAQDLPAAPVARPLGGTDVARYSLAPRPTLTDTRDGVRALSDDRADSAGGYRVLRNIKLTAGFRSGADRERIKPLTDANPDSQAVYVGTQLRF